MHTIYGLGLAIGLTGLMKLYAWGQKRYFDGLRSSDDLKLRVSVVEPATETPLAEDDLKRLIPASLARPHYS